MSTRRVNSTICRQMAEGVAEVYAANPAVAGAGLDKEDFVWLSVALINQELRLILWRCPRKTRAASAS